MFAFSRAALVFAVAFSGACGGNYLEGSGRALDFDARSSGGRRDAAPRRDARVAAVNASVPLDSAHPDTAQPRDAAPPRDAAGPRDAGRPDTALPRDAAVGVDATVTLTRLNTTVLSPKCIVCHDTRTKPGDLDFTTPQTAYTSMFEADGGIKIAVQSAANSANRKEVVPGDAINSFFYAKCAGTMGGSEGLSMPPGDTLTPTELTTLRNWINQGARNN